MPTFAELRDHARQRLSAELGRPATPEDVARLCDILGCFAVTDGSPPPVPGQEDHPMLTSALGEIARTFQPLIEQLQAELARLIAEAGRRDLGEEEAQKLAKGRLWHEFVMPFQEWANRDLPRLTLRQIRALVDRKFTEDSRLTVRDLPPLRYAVYRVAVEGPQWLTTEVGNPATWTEVETDWVEALPWRFGEEMELIRRAVYRLMEEAYARGKRGGQIDREVARQVNREFIGFKRT